MAVWGENFAFTVASSYLCGARTSLSLWRPKCSRTSPSCWSGTSSAGSSGLSVPAWTEHGFEWLADTKHSRSVLLKHGLVEEESTIAVSPGSKASGTNIRDGEDYLGEHEAKEHASIAGRPCSTTLWTDRTCSSRWVG